MESIRRYWFPLILALMVVCPMLGQENLPVRSEVGAEALPAEIAPIHAPFYMPQLQEPKFPDREVVLQSDGDTVTIRTVIIQKAIDNISAQGGGTVVVKGIWHTGRIVLKSNVNLHLAKGTELRFSGEVKDYQPAVFTTNEGVEVYSLGACIYANGQENIALTGEGHLIGPLKGSIKEQNMSKGAGFINPETPVSQRIYDGTTNGNKVFVPLFFSPVHCKGVYLEGVTFERSFFWNVVPTYCEDVIIRGVTVHSVGVLSGDGIDIVCCKNVLIEYCTMDCGDDNFAMKGGRDEHGYRVGKACENIVVRHCLALRGLGGITCGSETAGCIRNLYTHDCVFEGPRIGIRFKTRRTRAGGGENLYYERIRIASQHAAIGWEMLGHARWSGELAQRLPVRPLTHLTPAFRNINIKDIDIQGCREFISLQGIPESPVRNVRIENVNVDADRPRNSAVYAEDAFLNHADSNENIILLDDVDGFVLRNVTLKSKAWQMEVTDGRNIYLEYITFDMPCQPRLNVKGTLSKYIRMDGCKPIIKLDEQPHQNIRKN